MGRRELKLSTLEDLDGGRVTEAWQQAVKRVIEDCRDRPGVNKPRKILIEMSVTPVVDEAGEFDNVNTQFQIKDTTPDRKSKKYSMDWTRGNQLVFDDMSTEDINQNSLPFQEGDEQE